MTAGEFIRGRQYIDAVFFSRLLQHVPSQCAVCHGWGQQAVCDTCVARFTNTAARCRCCALQVPASIEICGECAVHPPAFDAAIAAADYSHPWSMLIARFKFRDGIELGSALAERLVRAREAFDAPLPDLVLPTPLSEQRLRERGFNQAWELARVMARRMTIKVDAQLLLRVKDAPHQLSLPLARRAGNVRGVFAVEPLRRAELRGRSVAVVDDVMTTGATAQEMAQVLKQAGASRVEIWALARTPRPV